MKKYKSSVISASVILIEFVVFLVWGLNIGAGDEMGYGLIVFYAIFPLTALIASSVLAAKKSVFFFPFAVLAAALPVILGFIVFYTADPLMGVFTLIPCAVGGIIGLIINRFKK